MTTVMALAPPVGLALAAPLGEWVGIRGVFFVAGSLGALAIRYCVEHKKRIRWKSLKPNALS
jgi:predicted MFS family arabinose efflux permease